MKTAFLPITIATIVVYTSCSTVYKTEQTPDDLYYSPTKELPIEAIVKNDDRNARYDEYISTNDDRYLRMKVANRYQWEGLDDYSYWNDSRYDFYGYNYYNNAYGYNYGGFYPSVSFGVSNFFGYGNYPSYYGYGNNFYNSHYGYGGYYNPYYSLAYYKNTSAPKGYTSGSNLSAYRNRNYNNYNLPNLPPSPQPRRDNSNSFSNLIRRVIAPPAGSSNTTPSTTVDRPARTFTPSTTPTSNTGGSSGGFGSSGSSSSAPRKPRG